MTLGCPGVPFWFNALAGLGAFCVLLLVLTLYIWIGEMVQDRIRGDR